MYRAHYLIPSAKNFTKAKDINAQLRQRLFFMGPNRRRPKLANVINLNNLLLFHPLTPAHSRSVNTYSLVCNSNMHALAQNHGGGCTHFPKFSPTFSSEANETFDSLRRIFIMTVIFCEIFYTLRDSGLWCL